MKSIYKKLTIPFLLLSFSGTLSANNADIYNLDIEQLINIKVVSASKKAESLLKAASAVYVISQDDIRRSGATTLPDVMRGVPGVQVAQVDANKWAVTMRGFNDRFASKLLVMVDGRTIYTPLFSGVYWNMYDMPLEDIDRVEIIRGPGGTLWGANAVNGVINIITKNAEDTQGLQLSYIGGSLEQNVSARYGGQINDRTHFRVYAKGRLHDKFDGRIVGQTGLKRSAHDRWRNLSSGFRIDGELDGDSDWMLQGGYNTGEAEQWVGSPSLMPLSNALVKDTIDYQAGNIVFAWNHDVSADNKWRVQAYYDYFSRTALDANNTVHTFDIEIQNQRQLFDNHNVVWGIGHRSVLDDLQSDSIVSFSPGKLHFKTFNAFIQDQIQLTDQFRLTVGTKIEHNDFTGFEYQPNARLLWEVNETHSLWASYSRAVRIPSRSNRDIRINFATAPGRGPNQPPILFSLFGSNDFHSEKVNAFEIGYRSLLTSEFSLDAALFYNIYEDIVSNVRNIPTFEMQPFPPHLLIGSTFDNGIKAHTYGAEIIAKWQVTPSWQLISSYTWFKMDARASKKNMVDSNSLFRLENSDPRHQFSVRSSIQLPHDLEFNSIFYYTDKLQGRGVSTQARLDLRLAWKPLKEVEVAVVGQNLTNRSHFEFDTTDAWHTNIPRSVYGKVTFNY